MTLDKAETVDFLKNVLNLNIPEIDDFKPSLLLLNTIVQSFLETIPFQSLTLIGEDVPQRRRPEWAEVKEAMFNKHGGLCYHMNLYLYRLLESLGFKVTMAHSTVTQNPASIIPNDHVIVYIHNLERDGDLYLAEVGFSCPTMEAIDMSFENESKIYKHSDFTYKYVKKDGKGFLFYQITETKEWSELYVFDLKGTTKLEQFYPFYDRVFSDPSEKLIFHFLIHVVHYPNKKRVSISNTSLKIEDDSGVITVTKMADDEEVVRAFKKYFPQFSGDLVRKAICNWRQVCPITATSEPTQ